MKTKAAIIGCGGRGRAHALGFAATEAATVVAVADPNLEAAASLAADHGFDAAAYSDHRLLLERERPEVVALCLWTPLHLPVLRDCIDAGVRTVLAEKPMAPTWGECQEMVRLSQANGVQLTFSHQRRYANGNRLARRLISEGLLGSLERMDLYAPPNLLDCGTHTFDQAMSFNAETPAKWAMCAVDTSETLNWFGVPSESVAIGTVVFENGVRAAFQFGGPDMDLWGGVRVVGTEGFLEVMWDGQFRRAVRYADPAWSPQPEEDSHDDHMRAYVADALRTMATGEEPELSARRALRAAEIIFACYESVRRRARVELPLTGFDDNPLHDLLRSAT